MIWQVLLETFKVYARKFPAIAVVTGAIWLPFNLFSYYSTFFVPIEEGFDHSEWLISFVQGLLWAFHTAAIMVLVKDPTRRGIGFAFREGAYAWGRLLVVRMVAMLIILVGLVLLIVPGIYMWVRLMYAEAVTVIEGRPIGESIERSIQLTSGKFFRCLGLALLLVALLIPGMVALFFLAPPLVPEYWILSSVVDLIINLFFALMIVGFVCGYRKMAIPGTPA